MNSIYSIISNDSMAFGNLEDWTEKVIVDINNRIFGKLVLMYRYSLFSKLYQNRIRCISAYSQYLYCEIRKNTKSHSPDY